MDLQEHRRLFIDEFCKRYLNQTGKEYNEKIDYILGHKICELCVRLEKERTNASEYLEWIFDYYVNDKYFKKYLPVTMDLLVKMWVINKYIYALVEAERASKKQRKLLQNAMISM